MIAYNKESKIFHLKNQSISYVFGILKNGQLGHFHFGPKVGDDYDQGLFRNSVARPLTACCFEEDQAFSLDNERLEYPTYGTTDFREPAFQLMRENGSRVTGFTYERHEIIKGKASLEGLPATYANVPDDCETLKITMFDSVIGCYIILSYTIFKDAPVITRSVRFINEGQEDVKILRAMSTSIDLFDSNFDWLQLSGAWARERHIKTRRLCEGIQSVGSVRGASSTNHNPFVVLKRPSCNEFRGEAYGFSLVYSGNFLAQAEVNQDGVSRVMLGIHPQNFTWHLESGSTFTTPEVVMVYTEQGLNHLSQVYHNLYRNNLTRGQWKEKPRPVLINNWEATYFDFNEEKILEIARASKKLGIDLFVLDDGWFGKRNDDTSSLGDWHSNTAKLPNGIGGLAAKIRDMGLGFGLWYEPEMINKDSELYRKHPDWIIGDPDRRLSHGRNQYVLDYSRPEVVDNIFDQMCQVLDGAPITYIKWDMNRNITEAFSRMLSSDKQGELFHRYILGVYDLYERLTSRYPEILFESCAAGGGRFDPGMLFYAPQGWISDDTDSVERLKIQYGTSMVYPISSMGSHVSAIPNHQVFRETSLKMRGDVAYFGTFGYELDVAKMSEEEMNEVTDQIRFFKENQKLIHKGDFYRLVSPFEDGGNTTAWMSVSKDGEEALVGYYQVLGDVNNGFKRLKLQGLLPEKRYRVNDEYTATGDTLMHFGILIKPSNLIMPTSDDRSGDFLSYTYKLKAE